MNPAHLQQIAQMVPFILMIVIFYFILIRPQQKIQKQRKEMLNSLKVEDRIITSGGIYATITKITPTAFKVKIAKDIEIKITRDAVASKMADNKANTKDED